MRFPVHLTCLITMVLMLVACKKDNNESPPTVRISMPDNGSGFAFGDVINVQIQVEDDVMVETLTITVADVNGVPALPVRTLNIDQQKFTAQQALPIDNVHLITGQHTIIARATDNNNTASDHRSITIQGAPLERKAIIAICRVPPAEVHAYSLDTDLNHSLLATMSGTFSDAAISSYDQLFWVGGGNSGDLTCFDADLGSVRWTEPNLNMGTQPFFTGLHHSVQHQRFFFGQGNGHLRGVSSSGIGHINVVLPNGVMVINTTVNDELLITDQSLPSGTGRQLTSYFVSTGAQNLSSNLDMEPSSMFPLPNDRILLFGERNGTGVIQDRSLTSIGVTDLQQFPQGGVQLAVAMDNDAYAFTLPSSILRFERNTNSTFLINNNTADDLAYSPADGLLVVADGNAIKLIDPGSGQMMGNAQLPHPIEAVLVLNNK